MRALVYFTRFGSSVGGSEYLVFSKIRELQANYEVTLALGEEGVSPASVAPLYGDGLDTASLKVVELFPKNRLLRLVDRHLKGVWRRRLRRLGPQFDLCVSCANPVDFGRPATHYVFMLTLDHAFMAHLWRPDAAGWQRLRDRLVCCRDALVRVLFGIRSARQIVRDGRETVIPNSHFAKRQIEGWYDCTLAPVQYPPTVFRTELANRSDCLSVGCIGRIGPEKRILEMIAIVRRARELSGLDLTFRIAGALTDEAYVRQVRAVAAQNAWVELVGQKTGEEKKAFLASLAIALHGRRHEEFGIAVTEYLKAGVVPIVPDEGGPAEIVPDVALQYATDEAAARILVRLVSSPELLTRKRAACRILAKRF